jgi:hypothetical protein
MNKNDIQNNNLLLSRLNINKYYMKQNIQNIIAEFIPIIILFLFLSKNKEFLAFSKTILGKMISIGLIIFYTIIDKMIGLFVCALIILFYQYEYKEMFENIQENIEDMEEINDDNIDDPVFLDIGTNKNEEMKKTKNVTQSKEDIFRKKNCKNGYLKYKGMNVNNEMAEHIFPEMKYKYNNVICNPCNNTCEISIIDNKLKLRETMGFP